MSTPPLPQGLPNSRAARIANRLHSTAIHLLRRARLADRETGLSAERLSVLSVLAFAGPKTGSQLADIEMVSRPAITRIVQSLEEAGLVDRLRGTLDRRQVVVRATRRGRKLMEAGRKKRVERIIGDLARLKRDELAVLDEATRLLESIDG
jgi:DNA-binding MarR family transcriptional regulator